MGRAKFSVCPCLFCLFLLQVDRAYKLINNLYCPCTFIPPIPFSGRRYSFYLFSDIYFVYKRIEYFRRQFGNFSISLYQPYKLIQVLFRLFFRLQTFLQPFCLFFQFLLFRLIILAQNRKPLVRNFAGQIVLIQPLYNPVYLCDPRFRFSLLRFGCLLFSVRFSLRFAVIRFHEFLLSFRYTGTNAVQIVQHDFVRLLL